MHGQQNIKIKFHGNPPSGSWVVIRERGSKMLCAGTALLIYLQNGKQFCSLWDAIWTFTYDLHELLPIFPVFHFKYKHKYSHCQLVWLIWTLPASYIDFSMSPEGPATGQILSISVALVSQPLEQMLRFVLKTQHSTANSLRSLRKINFKISVEMQPTHLYENVFVGDPKSTKFSLNDQFVHSATCSNSTISHTHYFFCSQTLCLPEKFQRNTFSLFHS